VGDRRQLSYGILHHAVGQKFQGRFGNTLFRDVGKFLSYQAAPNYRIFSCVEYFDIVGLNGDSDRRQGPVKWYLLRRILELTWGRLVGHIQRVRETRDLYMQYSETNVMNFLFILLRIKDLYMFRALLAHLWEEFDFTPGAAN
jgi:hypothetical protein